MARGLRASVSQEVRVLFNLVSRDLQSVTAKNIKLIKELADTDILTVGSHNVKEALHEKQVVNIPVENGMKVKYLSSLLRELQEAKYSVKEDQVKYLENLIDSLGI